MDIHEIFCVVVGDLLDGSVIEELGSDLFKECIGKHVFVLFDILRGFFAESVEFGFEVVSRSVRDNGFVADDLLDEFGFDGSGRICR